MILFFRTKADTRYAVGTAQPLQKTDVQKLTWLFGGAEPLTEQVLEGRFLGPRKEMITPWSTNAVEITQTMGIAGITRIEEFEPAENSEVSFDRMLQHKYTSLDQDLFTIVHTPEQIIEVDDIKAYSDKEGLALSNEEISYLESGHVNILLAQDCYGWGERSVKILVDKIVNNKEPASKMIYDPLTEVTKANAAEWSKNWEKWKKK